MKYRKIPKHWKYRLEMAESVQTELKDMPFSTSYMNLRTDGMLWCRAGFAWDGATGAPDSKDIMKASLMHDSLYWAMARGYLDIKHKTYADELLRDIYLSEAIRLAPKKNGKISWFRMRSINSYAKTIHWAVKTFGGRSLSKRNYPEVEIIEI